MNHVPFRKIFITLIILLCVSAAVFAGGNKEVPEIPPVSSGTQYISPNGDGIQDEASITFSVNIHVKSKEGYVPEYGMQIIAPDGTVVTGVQEKEKSDVGWFASLFRGYDLFTMQRTITWDGKDEGGNIVGDGVYNVRVYVVDSSKNRKEIDVDTFIVDTVIPSADIIPPADNWFSPNGDDIAEVFIIQQEGSVEAVWLGEILNESGTVVKTFTWENTALADLLWDGTADDGRKAADGLYSYRLSCTDLAGNSFDGYVFEDFMLDASTPRVYIYLDNPHFSPNGDGVKDTVTVTTKVEAVEDVISWSGSFVNDRNTVSIRLTGDGKVPPEYEITGFREDGSALPEGFYTISYSVEYPNGYRSVASERIKLDITPPVVQATYNKVFSPNGDGMGDTCDVILRSDEKIEWLGRVEDADGNPVVQTDSGNTTTLARWDGRDRNGNIVPDGTYYASAVFTDLAGNSADSEVLPIRVDNRSTPITLKVPTGFSPNDSRDDMLPVGINAALTEEISRWVLTIEDENGESWKLYTGTGELPDIIFWDGSMNPERGTGQAPEGFYTARLRTIYDKGDVVNVVSGRFALDTLPPRIRVDISSTPVAITPSGTEGGVFLEIRVDEETEVTNWELDIQNNEGEVVRSYVGSGDPSGQVVWNGDMDDPEKASADDIYTIKLSVTDMGGNTSVYEESTPIDILVVIRNGKYYLMVPNIIFGAYKHGLDSAGDAMYKRNMASLNKVIELHKRYPQYSLGLEGHALNIYLGGSREKAEEKILFPLTENRARTVLNALVRLGFPADMLSFKAYGGQDPVVSVTNSNVWWRNRRVEFIVIVPEQ